MSNKTKAELDKETVQQRVEIKALRKALDHISLLHYTDPHSRDSKCVECGRAWPCETKTATQEAWAFGTVTIARHH